MIVSKGHGQSVKGHEFLAKTTKRAQPEGPSFESSVPWWSGIEVELTHPFAFSLEDVASALVSEQVAEEGVLVC